jgi:hypothetical protein
MKQTEMNPSLSVPRQVDAREWLNKMIFILEESRYFKNKLDHFSQQAFEENLQSLIKEHKQLLISYMEVTQGYLSELRQQSRRNLTSNCQWDELQKTVVFYQEYKLQIRQFLDELALYAAA